jgi:hypothetical protein
MWARNRRNSSAAREATPNSFRRTTDKALIALSIWAAATSELIATPSSTERLFNVRPPLLHSQERVDLPADASENFGRFEVKRAGIGKIDCKEISHARWARG